MQKFGKRFLRTTILTFILWTIAWLYFFYLDAEPSDINDADSIGDGVFIMIFGSIIIGGCWALTVGVMSFFFGHITYTAKDDIVSVAKSAKLSKKRSSSED